MNLLITLLLIGLRAVYEALYDTGRKAWSGRVKFIYLVAVPVLAFAWLTQQPAPGVRETRMILLLIGYAFMHFAVFDFIYNATRGDVPLNYIGTTKDFDKFLRKLNLHPTLLIFLRLIALFWGIAWLAGWKDGIINIAKSLF